MGLRGLVRGLGVCWMGVGIPLSFAQLIRNLMIMKKMLHVNTIRISIILLFAVFDRPVLMASMSCQMDNIRYNWSKLGLELKEEPKEKSQTIDIIPFSKEMQLLSVTGKHVELEIKGTINVDLKSRTSLYLRGYWVKIKYNSKEGYVMDCFLYKYPPPKLKEGNPSCELVENFESYFDRNYELLDIDQELRNIQTDYYKEVKFYEKGVVFENSRNTGWFSQILIVPNSSIKQGILFFLLKNCLKSEEGIYIDDLLQVEYDKDNNLEIQVDNIIYGIHQFGSNLIFTYIGS
jgi:hypothetical protein